MDRSGLHEGRSFCYFVKNTQIWQQALGTSERSLCHTVHELHYFAGTETHIPEAVNSKEILNLLQAVSYHTFFFTFPIE